MTKMSTPEWCDFQEEIKEHFISIGADAESNKRVVGVRTKHDVDVFVQTKFLGQDLVWLIEAKHWKKRINKEHVLALRMIVDDVGADRGFIISKAGFQKGAMEAANSSNVKLKTFEELKVETKGFIETEILKSYEKRLNSIEDRYWSHSKRTRIEYDLRHDVTDMSMIFTGQNLLSVARIAVEAAKTRKYPIDLATHMKEHKGDIIAHNFQQLTNWLNLNLNHFDKKLQEAEWAMFENGDYKPNIKRADKKWISPSVLAAAASSPDFDYDKLKEALRHELNSGEASQE
jgi:hypothetical protein